LSLGERKRIAIATVLAMDPAVLVLDEPSAGLDPRSRRNLIHFLQDLPQTLLVASHDMRLMWELCHRTVILDGGRVVAHGPTTELLLNTALMEHHGLESPYRAADTDTEASPEVWIPEKEFATAMSFEPVASR